MVLKGVLRQYEMVLTLVFHGYHMSITYAIHTSVHIGQFRQIHRIFFSPDRKFIECMECNNTEW